MKFKILSTVKNFTVEAVNILKEVGEIDCLELSQEELMQVIGKYDILFVQLGLNVNRAAIDKALNLKVIATVTTGLDHIDTEYAEKKGIKILSLRDETEFLSTITSTAELAFGLMIDLLRLNHPAFESVKEYKWDREKYRGHSLSGKTLGIVGLGRLGKLMARYGQAFFMKVLAYDPYISSNIFEECGVEKVSFDQLLERSDVVSVFIHLNKDTEDLFNKEVFQKIKPTAYLINTARGKLVNEDDLLWALENKKIAGYATDGLAEELNFNEGFLNQPLVEYAKRNDNLIIVPHTGGTTYESREATDVFMAKKIKDFLLS